MSLRDLERDYEKSEDDIKALQSVGQIIGEVLKQLDEERCKLPPFVLSLRAPS
jgi:26S proteasome regulatory subunit T4